MRSKQGSASELALVARAGGIASSGRAWVNASDEERKLWAARALEAWVNAPRDAPAMVGADGLVELLVAYLEKDAVMGASREKTVRAYVLSLRAFLVWAKGVGGVNLLRLTPNQVDGFKLWLHAGGEHRQAGSARVLAGKVEAGLSVSTVRQRVSGVAAFYAALRWATLTDAVPFRDVKLPSAQRGALVHQRAMRPNEVEALLRCAKLAGERELVVVVLLGAHAGLRASEITALLWSDVSVDPPRVTVRSGKRGVARSVEMSDSLRRALVVWRVECGGRAEAFVVPGLRSQRALYARLEDLWDRARTFRTDDRPFRGVGVHGLRHYAGVRLADEARDLRVVRDHLGHASTRTTEVYAGRASADFVREW